MPANKMVLVVEDDKGMLDVTCKYLGSVDFATICARSIPEAYRLFESENPFMVLTDLSLANHVDGSTMAAQMHMKDPMCIFVAISGFVSVFDLGYLLGSVFTDVLQKPISMRDLERIVTYGWEKRKRWEVILSEG